MVDPLEVKVRHRRRWEGDTVAVVGHGSVSLGGDPHVFVYSEVFTFTDGLVSRLDTFHIWLGDVPA